MLLLQFRLLITAAAELNCLMIERTPLPTSVYISIIPVGFIIQQQQQLTEEQTKSKRQQLQKLQLQMQLHSLYRYSRGDVVVIGFQSQFLVSGVPPQEMLQQQWKDKEEEKAIKEGRCTFLFYLLSCCLKSWWWTEEEKKREMANEMVEQRYCKNGDNHNHIFS